MELIRRYHSPIPTRSSKSAVNTFAESLADALEFAPGSTIAEIVSIMGGAIHYRDPVGDAFPESILVESENDFAIFLPSMTTMERDRFTIAHELGHLFLHFPLIEAAYPGDGMRATRWVDVADADQQRAEWEANWFAAGFVMPAEKFTAVYMESPSAAASIFGVSSKAASVRAESLGLV